MYSPLIRTVSESPGRRVEQLLQNLGELGALPAHGALDDRAGARLARRRPPREALVKRCAEDVHAVEEHRDGGVEDLQADGGTHPRRTVASEGTRGRLSRLFFKGR